MFLWLKLLHLFFVVSWFAGLFYLPRIFVNLAQARYGSAEYTRLADMARRLYRFMSPLGYGSVVFGAGAAAAAGFHAFGWVYVKLVAGLLLLGYQLYCGRLLADFQNGCNRRSHKWFRVFNELPVLLMILALYMVVFKPF